MATGISQSQGLGVHDFSQFIAPQPIVLSQDNLGSNIPQNIKEKIWKNEYVELGILTKGLRQETYDNNHNRANRDKKSFFRFPAVINNSDEITRDLSQKRRRLWLAAVNREDLAFKDTRYMRVCSDHFVGGSPSALYQDTHPGWIPSVKLGYDKGDKGDMGSRFFRLQGRKEATRLRDLRFDEEEQQSEAEPDAEHAEPVDQDITPEEELKSCKIKIDILKSENESLKHENLLLKKIVHKMKANNTEDFDGDDDKKPSIEVIRRNYPRINTIEEWTDAFLIFVSIYLEKFGGKAQHMLKYMNIVRMAATRMKVYGWRSYDQQFRLRHAHNPHEPWSVINNELWLMFATPSSSVSINPYYRQGQGQGQDVKPNMRTKRQLPCYDFNLTKCSRSVCRYAHVCTSCSKPHLPAFVRICQSWHM
ncbi:uncharacterized protein LOC125374841 [Haliotis rufescens]|uniref:uncharacterized protein LOC125374841 n=1 Tax=Haliotis rufescens TaxID=6454 RepID=UPI00201EAD6E|nr:uncharacterized protein LOC125374841 [Haliotis rufescens]